MCATSRVINKYLPDIKLACNFVNDNLINRLIKYASENYTYDMIFNKSNFMHLCGVKYEKGASDFFRDILDDKLELDKIQIKDDGSTIVKLQIISNLQYLFDKNIFLGPSGRIGYTTYDGVIEHKVMVLLLKRAKSVYVPNSILNKTRSSRVVTERVKSIEIYEGNKLLRSISY